ncbi:MAG: Uma2 family endonuclease [Gemmatimonadetes bacterium]|nr:Uma2 family endonuclease [Gemmatimonadota bacterium]
MFPSRMTAPLTAAELEHLSFPDKQVELIRGRLVVLEPPSSWHGAVSVNLSTQLSNFVRRHALGVVFGQDTGFKIFADPDTVRAADVAFVARERMSGFPRRGYAAVTPDLVAEVLSPDDRAGEVLAKVADWLRAGARAVWVIDPQRAQALVYRPDGSLSIVGEHDALDGEEILPGFSCLLSDILAIA